MKIKYIKANTVDAYFDLPKKEREWFGLYRKPYALPLELFSKEEKGWEYFYEEIRKQYPIQWFIREWLFSYDNPVYSFFKRIHFKYSDLKYAIQNFISPAHPRWRKTLPRHKYSDITHLAVESNFNLILDFYHSDKENGNVAWDFQEDTKKFYKELESVVNWIEKDRSKWQKEIDDELGNATLNNKGMEYEKKYEQYNRLEKLMLDKETEILKWFIDNRGYFWW